MSRIDETRPFIPVRIAVLTISDTRTLENDKSGNTLSQLLGEAGPPGGSDLTPFPTPTAWETSTPAMEMTVIPLATPTPSQ